jgi:hypothetical protein
MTDKVACHSETMYAERPISFEYREIRLQVYEIFQRWRTPQGMRFRVVASDDQVYELTYDLAADSWLVIQL